MTLDQRLAALLVPLGAQAKRMFGGTCYMIAGHMIVGTMKDEMLVRVGKEGRSQALKQPGARPFDVGGRQMQAFVVVASAAIAADDALRDWIDRARAFAATLPPKQMKPPRKKQR